MKISRGLRTSAVALIASLLIATWIQVPDPRVVTAAASNSYSTLGSIEMSPGSCGADDANSVINGTGIRRIINAPGGVTYVVGCFTDFAGVAEADYVAMWDGTNWSGLGNSGDINSVVYDAAIFRGDLVIVGNFTDAGGNSAADMITGWDPSANSGTGGWKAFPTADPTFGYAACTNGQNSPKSGLNDYLSVVTVDDQGTSEDTSDDTLIVGGDMYYGICDGRSGYTIAYTSKVARWNGTGWEALDDSAAFDGFNSQKYIPRAILVDGDHVYIGAYKLTALSSDTLGKYKHAFVVFNGTSFSYPITSVSPYSDGSGFGVMSLAKSSSGILLGGTFYNLNYTASYVAEYSAGAITSFNSFSIGGGSGAVIRDLEVVRGQLFVGGAFATGPSGSVGSAVARWNGTSWSGFSNSDIYGVNDLEFDNAESRLLVGNGGVNLGGLAHADGLVAVKINSTSGFDSITSTNSTSSLVFLSSVSSYALNLAYEDSSEIFNLVPKESATKVVASVGLVDSVIQSGSFSINVTAGSSTTVVFSTDATDGSSSSSFSVTVSRDAAPATTTTSSTTTTTTTTTSSTTTTQPPQQQLEVRVNKMISLRDVAAFVGLSIPRGATLTATVTRSSSSFCRIVNANVKGLKRGQCNLVVAVRRNNGSTVSRQVSLRVR